MSSNLRSEVKVKIGNKFKFHISKKNFFCEKVLKAFKNLHRTRLKVFQRDDYALSLSRDKINEEFKNKKHVTDENSIRELIKHADDVETILRTQVVQLEKTETGNFSNLFLYCFI